MTVENTVSVESPAEPAVAAPAETHGVELTDEAAIKARTLLEQEGRDDLRLRVAVQPGGCSGLRYQLFFDERDARRRPGARLRRRRGSSSTG